MRLSIITINYNNLLGLKRTMESVVNQTWQEFEYIVIDGGSTDGSVEYIEEQKYRVDHWVSEPDKGIYNAMNKGVLKASGDYLLFLNSGDHLFNLETLQNCNKFLVEKDLIYFDINFVDGMKSWITKYPEKLFFSHFILDTLPHPATFIKRNLFNQIGFYDENLKVVSDWKFFIECVCKHNSTYIKIDETLSTFYLDGLSSNPKNKEIIFKERQQVLKSNFSTYLDDIVLLNDLKRTVSNLKESRKIKMLIKFGLLKKF